MERMHLDRQGDGSYVVADSCDANVARASGYLDRLKQMKEAEVKGNGNSLIRNDSQPVLSQHFP